MCHARDTATAFHLVPKPFIHCILYACRKPKHAENPAGLVRQAPVNHAHYLSGCLIHFRLVLWLEHATELVLLTNSVGDVPCVLLRWQFMVMHDIEKAR